MRTQTATQFTILVPSLMLLALLTCVFAAPALASPPWGKGKEPPSVDERLKKMTEKLGLSTEQQSQLRPILEAGQTETKPLRENMRAAHEQMRAIHKKIHEQIDALLTDEQRAKHKAQREERHKKWKRGQRGDAAGDDSRY